MALTLCFFQGIGYSLPQILFVWSCCLAVIAGTTAAMQLGRQRGTEALLPTSPFQKVLVAYLVSGRNLFFVISLPLSFCFWKLALPWPWPSSLSCRIALSILTVIHLHLLSFLLSYWFGQGITGGGLAALIGFGEVVVCRNLVFFEHVLSSDSEYYGGHATYPFNLSILLPVALLVSLTGGLFSLRFLAKEIEIERKIGLRRAILAILAVFIFTAGSVSALFTTNVLNEIQFDKQKRTFLDLRAIGTAVEEFAVDHSNYPSVKSMDELTRVLVPKPAVSCVPIASVLSY